MNKWIYSGNLCNSYLVNRFRTFLQDSGAELSRWSSSSPDALSLSGVESGQYVLDGVIICYESGYGIPPSCSIFLSGEEEKVGRVERIILAEQARLASSIHLGMQD